MGISEEEIEAESSFKEMMTENFRSLEAIWISKFMKLLTPQIQPEEVFIQIQYYETVKSEDIFESSKWNSYRELHKAISGLSRNLANQERVGWNWKGPWRVKTRLKKRNKFGRLTCPDFITCYSKETRTDNYKVPNIGTSIRINT